MMEVVLVAAAASLTAFGGSQASKNTSISGFSETQRTSEPEVTPPKKFVQHCVGMLSGWGALHSFSHEQKLGRNLKHRVADRFAFPRQVVAMTTFQEAVMSPRASRWRFHGA